MSSSPGARIHGSGGCHAATRQSEVRLGALPTVARIAEA